MTTSLIDSLNTIATPEVSAHIASKLGESANSVESGLTAGMASMLAGVAERSGDPAAMRSVFDTVTNAENDGRVLDNPTAFLGGAQGSPLTALGAQFMAGIFGGRASTLHDALAKSTGLRVRSVESLMQFGAPLVLAVLGRRVRDGGLNLGSFTQLFTDECDSLHSALPPGVADVIVGRERAARIEPMDRAERMITPEHPVRRGWVRPAVGALAVLAMLWGLRASLRRHAQGALVAPAATRIAGGDVAPALATSTLKLLNGTVLNVPSSSAEGRLAAFLTDSMRRVNDTTWFELDNTRFETNSSTLTSDSDAQIKNVAAILKAYPNASVKIGAYTDSTGNETANVRLSRSRAESVRRAIMADSISGSRVSAEGYGSQHPVASNNTEEGRSKNRRIAVRVVRK